jgi:CO/xanthine dehydrogenase FAD-binding subunit
LIKEILVPFSIDNAKSNLENYKNSKVLAGGTDLMLDISKKDNDTEYLISLNKVDELKEIKEYNYHVVLGSLATFTQIAEANAIKKNFECISDCCKTMGSLQIRNIATIGGNIVNAAPAADIVPCLMTLGTVFIIESSKTMRRFKCDEYFENFNKLQVKDNEILTQIIITKSKGVSGFYKLGKRNALSISRMSASCYLEVETDQVTTFKVAMGAVGRFPMRLRRIEELVKNKPVDYLYSDEVIETIKDIVFDSISNRKSAPFKREAAAGVYRESLNRALSRLDKRGREYE